MGTTPRFISECPNVENTLPLAVFRAQSPARYSHAEGDKLVLYAGHGACELEIESPSSSRPIDVHEKILAADSNVAVFVLDTSFVLWFTNAAEPFGVELPYPLIALHALKETDGEPVLYLQVLSSDLFNAGDIGHFQLTVELALRTKPGAHNPSPLLSSASSVLQIYDALGTCSALHYDTESDGENGENGEFGENSENSMFGAGHRWITAETESANVPQIEVPSSWTNSGIADDLGITDDDADLDGEAGMNVAVEYVTVAGVVRRRASVSEEAQKLRRIS